VRCSLPGSTLTLVEVKAQLASGNLSDAPSKPVGDPGYMREVGYRAGWNDATHRALRILEWLKP
jgi:hypothetical protein